MGGLSSSVVIALAAVLWLAYLVPTWFRRREYLSTERNTVRLQQTLRILAETAEVPDAVRVENTARSVAEQEKIMQREMQRTRAIERAQQAAEARAAARRLAESHPQLAARIERSSLQSRRLRRSRLISTAVLSLAVVGLVVGGVQAASGMPPVLLIASGVVAAGTSLLLYQLAAVSRTRAQLADEVRQAAPIAQPVRDLWQSEQPQRPAGWTPTPLPKPLYLSKPDAPAARVSFSDAAARLARSGVGADAPGTSTGTEAPVAAPAAASSESGVGSVVAVRDAAAEMRAASDEAEQALRQAQQEVPSVAERAASAPATEAPASAERSAPVRPQSRFASMGVIDDADLAPADINEALRRRRAV